MQAKLNSGGGGAVTSVNGQTGVVTLTKADIGLANIDNTSDSNKPVSVATQTALDGKAALAHTHTASQISDSTVTGRSVLTATDAATARTAIGAGTSNLTIGTSSGTAKAGDYTPTKSDVGLGNVDNTSDTNKPISTATQTALDGKVNIADLVTLTDRGAWTPSTTYDEGDIVTHQYARWYRKTTGSGGASFTASEWIHLGLYAIGATGDPGGGMLWIDVS